MNWTYLFSANFDTPGIILLRYLKRQIQRIYITYRYQCQSKLKLDCSYDGYLGHEGRIIDGGSMITYGFDTACRPMAATVDTTATAAPTTAQRVACSLRVGFSNAKEGCS